MLQRFPSLGVLVTDERAFTPSQKQEMIQKLTDTMVEIEGENMRSVTWEVKSGEWGIGGKGITVSDVKALAEGRVKV